MQKQLSLQNLHVLVTRPEGLAQPLCDDIVNLGGTATHFPVIEISSSNNLSAISDIFQNIKQYDMALFISSTAVNYAAQHINLSRLNIPLGAIGNATAASIEKLGGSVEFTAKNHNSESLLELPILQTQNIQNKRIIIFKGKGGRTLLSDTLISRHAIVTNAELYQRLIPKNYSSLTKQSLANINIILISSGEGLTNLSKMTSDLAFLKSIKIIVPSTRCADIASNLGFKSIIIADNATNSAYLQTLLNLS